MIIKKLFLPIFFMFFFVYEEFIFHLFTYKNFTSDFLLVILFSLSYGALSYILSNLFKNKLNRIPIYAIQVILTFIFISNYIYYKVYASIISFYSLFHGGQVLGFFGRIIEVLINNWYVVLLIFLPLIIFIIFDLFKKISFERSSILYKLIIGLVFAFSFGGSLLIINYDNSKDIYSNKNLYYNINSMVNMADRFGVVTAFRIDSVRTIFGFKDKDISVKEPVFLDEDNTNEEKAIVYDDNVLEIDFDKLISEESNDSIKAMHEYFSSQSPTSKNKYTGMFEGKNLIVLVAEAFSNIAIDKNLTPNLYRLYIEGFQFNNFYTPLFPVSTGDGEYISDTGLIPKEGVWSLYKLEGNYMPFSYANSFKSLGYSNNSYHDNTYTYYHRDVYLKAMGYDNYRACRNGLNINCKIWPQSDAEMMEDSINDYINNDKFLAYYMTVSGHLEYSRNGNMMVTKNWDKVKDLPYSDKAKSYYASQIELDKAIGYLIEKLEETGKLKDTVIAISGDHYPYGLSLSEINEISSYERDEDFTIHNMPFLIWNIEMKEPIVIDKYSSSLDVLPTLLNLFGIDYDSRIIIGKDILADNYMPLVIFSNRSFITSKCKYNARTKEVTQLGSEECTKEYIDSISGLIYNKYKYSAAILDNDYYRVLYTNMGWLK